VSRWIATMPNEWQDGWEGRLQITYDYDTKTEVCGHLHRSSAEAGRCAQERAAQLNSMIMPFGSRIPQGMPSDYYLD
jgi:hypothetical protein